MKGIMANKDTKLSIYPLWVDAEFIDWFVFKMLVMKYHGLDKNQDEVMSKDKVLHMQRWARRYQRWYDKNHNRSLS